MPTPPNGKGAKGEESRNLASRHLFNTINKYSSTRVHFVHCILVRSQAGHIFNGTLVMVVGVGKTTFFMLVLTIKVFRSHRPCEGNQRIDDALLLNYPSNSFTTHYHCGTD